MAIDTENPQNWLHLAKINPELEQILSASGAPPPQLAGTIASLRTIVSERRKALTATHSPSAASSVIEKDIAIPSRDGHAIPVRIHAPESPSPSGSPVVVILHGGGFCLGGFENEELNCRNFAGKLGAVCVNVDYRLAPEHPFPAAVEDCWDALQWVAAHAKDIDADPSKGFIVGGTSAGGNLSAVMGLLARDHALSPPLTGLYLSIPAVLSDDVVPAKYAPLYLSYEQNRNAPLLPVSAIKLFMNAYKPDTASPLYNPFNHPQGHKGLPPVYFQICGMDPLRDEALLYERVLREEYGIPTKLDIYSGLPHGFWIFWPDMEASRGFVDDTTRGVGWLLEGGREGGRGGAEEGMGQKGESKVEL